MGYHIIAFFFGFLLDLAFGDPYFLPHPIRLIGSLIANVEKWLRRKKESGTDEKSKVKELRQGTALVVIVVGITTATAAVVLIGAYSFHPYIGVAVESIMTYQILAIKSLKTESMKVYTCLDKQDLQAARKAVSMIVGRDTEILDETGVAKAAIETVAENTSDGVIAPMLYTALGGPVAGFFYKAVNTLDSMVGYKSEGYLYFGRAAAKLDDLVNFIPARISAVLMLAVAFISGKSFSGRNAVSIYRRDRKKHASPNSAQTEAACAGALGIQLAGDAFYFGKLVRKPYIGEALRPVEKEDIRRANRLLYATAWLCELLCLVVLMVVYIK